MFECVIIGVCDNGMWDSFALLSTLFFGVCDNGVIFLFHFFWKCLTVTPNAGRREYNFFKTNAQKQTLHI